MLNRVNTSYTALLLIVFCGMPCLAKCDQNKQVIETFERRIQENPDDFSLIYAVGKAYYAIGEFQKAAAILERALSLRPDSLDAKTYLGLSYLFTDDITESKRLLEDVLKVDASNPDVLAALGRLYQLEYKLDEAKTFYLRALEIDPQNFTALSFYGSLLIEENDFAEALKIYKELKKNHPDSAGIQQDLKRAELGPEIASIKAIEEGGNLRAAKQRYEELLSENRDFLDLYLLLGKIYLRLEKPLKSIELYQQGIAYNLSKPPLFNALGYTYLDIESLGKAEDLFERVLTLEPSSSDALAGLGKVAKMRGNVFLAEKLFRKALSHNPYNFNALNYLGELQMENKQYSEAIDTYKKILQILPGSQWVERNILKAEHGAFFDKVEAEEEEGDFHAVEDLYLQLIAESPENPLFYQKLGDVYSRNKEAEKAVDVFESALEIAPTSRDILTQLGFAYLSNNQIYLSERTFKQALNLDQENADAIVGLAAIAERDGNFQDAESLFRKALDLDHTNFNAHFYFAQLKMEQKRFSEAERLLRAIRDRDPEAEWLDSYIRKARFGPLYDKIETQKKARNIAEVERLYAQLIDDSSNSADAYLELSAFYLEEARPAEAEDVILEGLNYHPLSTPLLTTLGFALLKQGKLMEARLMFQQVLQSDAADGEALAGLGIAALKQNDFKQAESYLKRALIFQPDSITALTSLGEFYTTQGQYEKAEEVYGRLFELFPDKPWVKFAYQESLFRPLLEQIASLEKVENQSPQELRKNRMKAETLYLQLLAEAGDNPNFSLRYGQLLVKMGRLSEALQVYRQSLAQNPSDIPLMLAVGYTMIFGEDYAAAEQQFREVLALAPTSGDAWAGLGRVFERLNKPSDALGAYNKALFFEPDNINALSFLAGIFVKNEKFDEAKALYEKLLALSPEKGWVKEALAEIRMIPQLKRAEESIQNGELERAAQIYRQLLGDGQNGIESVMRLGNLYITMRRYTDAADVFIQGLKNAPENPRLMTAAGLAYVLNKDPEKGRKWLERALIQEPNEAGAIAGLGKVAFLENNRAKAEKLYQQALAISPDNSPALSFYGELLFQEKRYEEAEEIYARLSEVEQNARWARKAREEARFGRFYDGARALTNIGERCKAEQQYLSLLSSMQFSGDIYLELGDLYFSQEHFYKGLWTYYQGLLIDPLSPGLWRATAKAYLALRRLTPALFIFNCLVATNPDDASSWAGLGRAFALMGCIKESFAYYAHALSLDPKNEDALNFLALGELERERFRSSRDFYSRLSCVKPEKIWVQNQLLTAHQRTRPSVRLEGNFHEEDEFNAFDESILAARYQVYGGGVRVTAPINDFYRMGGLAQQEFYRLVAVQNDAVEYFFGLTRGKLFTRRAYGCYGFLDANIGASVYGPVGRGTFCQRQGIIIEPTVLYTNIKPDRTFIAGFDTETNLVGRDFNENIAKIVPRYILLGSYERDLFETVTYGIFGSTSYLNGFQANYLQQGLFFADWRPYALRCLSFRYTFLALSYSKVIPEYFTYAPQLKNQLQCEYRIKFLDEGLVKLGYAFGFQDSRTRFQQIIVDAPIVIGPLFWDRRLYNMGYVKASYNQCPFNINLEGDFFRDSKKYTIWNINLNLEWIF